MNERIRLLAVQANLIASEYNGFDRTTITKAEQQFAELIVKECTEQIIAKGTDWMDFAPSQLGIRPEYAAMAKHINEHFGVEE